MRQRVRSKLHPARGERPRLVLVEESARVAGHAPVLLAEEAGRDISVLRRPSRSSSGAASVSQLRKPSSNVSTAVPVAGTPPFENPLGGEEPVAAALEVADLGLEAVEDDQETRVIAGGRADSVEGEDRRRS
jgi:hypothetical protein